MSDGKQSKDTISTEQVTQKLFAQIVDSAKKGQFEQADALRAQLIEKVPTALSEIIKSDSVIEEAKTAALDKDHLAIWDDLYQDLSDEEVNCLFYSMKKVVVPPKKKILVHGGLNNKLFFIDKGHVTVYFPKDGKNVVIAQLGRGDMLGEYTFATISLCSASVISSSEVELRYIESEKAISWLDTQPALYDKVIRYCNEHGKIDQIVSNKKLQKRKHKRFDARGIAAATILTKEGKKTDSVFKGGLSNVSLTGCCIDIRCSTLKTAKALLARHLYLVFDNQNEVNPHQLGVVGKVVRVSAHLHSDYSVHIRFVKEQEEDAIKPHLR